MNREKENVKTVFNTTYNTTCSDNITNIKYILDKNWQVS